MKKILALLLCLLLLAALAACKDSGSDTVPSSDAAASDATTASETSTAADTTAQPTEEDDHNHINYKGLRDVSYTIDDVSTAEGREPDFSVDQSDTTIYIYNNVTLDALTFTQVQYTFSATGNRISCTYTADSGLEEILAGYKAAMTDLYGTPAEGNSSSYPVYTWRDGHTANYVMLTQLNETTVQLAFYLKEGAQ